VTSPSPLPPGRQDPPAPYPAPYEEPWGRLAVDLRAVLASTGLKLRELSRRNREGVLSVPGFWPTSLASLFWPLLLVLGMAAVLAIVLGLARGLAAPSVTPPSPVPVPATRTVAPPVAPSPREPLQPMAGPPGQSPAPLPASPVVPPAEPESEPLLQLDPLLTLLAEDDPEGCIASVRPDPQQGRLDLEMAAPFLALSPARRQQQADAWLQRSLELGYGRLRLLDANGAPLGQAARVGSGMVLLEPPLGPEA
jgi:hypothetical protein